MGEYLNIGSEDFQIAINSKIYVDKTELIAYTNSVIATEDRFVCVSRPRRYGKSMAAKMLAAYYGLGEDTKAIFSAFKIAKDPSFESYLNRYNTIFLNMQSFLSNSESAKELKTKIAQQLSRELKEQSPALDIETSLNLASMLKRAYSLSGVPFVVIIDEWDCIFRDKKYSKASYVTYLDFLRDFLKDNKAIHLAYMTGILPIKKYGTHSALSMFTEFSMISQMALAPYTGFLEEEVASLIEQSGLDMDLARQWYDGYRLQYEGKILKIYSPKSVVDCVRKREFMGYWMQTETYEALKTYIEIGLGDIRSKIALLLSGGRSPVEVASFANDMSTFSNSDEILTLLVHLGYLGYDAQTREVFIPNEELANEFVTAMKASSSYSEIAKAIRSSQHVLESIWEQDSKEVAKGIEEARLDLAILQYNNEIAPFQVVSFALYNARQYYMKVYEMPAGKGFADIVYLPRPAHMDKPALIVELKWGLSAQGAIAQIHNKKYVAALKGFQGKVLLVGINYDEDTKVHSCEIEEIVI